MKTTEDFYETFNKANKWSKEKKLPVLIHVKTGPEMVLPGKRFSAL